MGPADDHREDRELHRRLIAGCRQAASSLYQRHLAAVQRTCRAVLGDNGLAEDVAQEVFIEYFANPQRVDLDRSPLTAFLSLMARRRAIDLIRSRESGRRRERLAIEAATTPVDQLAVSLERVPVSLDVWGAVAKLPPPQRAMVRRAFLGDQTYREAAADLGIAEGTAKYRMRSALTRLRGEPALAEAA